MKTFEIRNYGVKGIEWLIEKFEKMEITPKSIQQLKDEVFDSFINNNLIDFSTKGNVSVTIVDLENMTNCEIIYENRYE